ncbi:hypothetical protein NW762_007848 [Fusarium torreyae]|uniref:Uncharacterized protein n=1 Tax=Fusarium torreyae TaxID=1237075 RepID=A0A9W8VG08_9HYPO|nr:hypothetical protein NW762_007848 [Fusarium torreyae]
MVRRLVLSLFVASAFHSFDVVAGPCRPPSKTTSVLSGTVTKATDVSTDGGSQSSDVATGLSTDIVGSLTTDLSASLSIGVSTDTSSNFETDSSVTLPTGVSTESASDLEATSTTGATSGLTDSFTLSLPASFDSSATTGEATETTGSASGLTIDTTSDTITGSETGSTATSDTTDSSSFPTTTSLAYCYSDEWLNDALITSFNADKDYAEDVCTSAIQPVTTVAGEATTETQPVTTSTMIVTVTEDHAGETKIVVDAPSTDYVAGDDVTVTAVHRDGSIEILEPKTVYNTVATTTVELPTAYETITTTDVDYIGTTSTETVLNLETETTTVITDTVEITTGTSTDVTTETVTSVESIPTTTTDYVVTGTTYKFAPGITIHVTNSRTFVVYSVASTRTHTSYTSTDYLTSTWTTVTVESTDTDYTTVPTTTFDVTTTTSTVEETITTSTDTAYDTSTVTTNEWTTETTVSTSTHTSTSTWTEHFFPWWQNRKRAAATAGLQARVAVPEEEWLNQYGEKHFRSACSCIVTFPLPTRTVYAAASDTTASADYKTIIEKSTTIDKVYADTVTLTLTTAATVTTHKTVTETLVVDGTTSVETRTVYEDVTETVLSTPNGQAVVTQHVTNNDVERVTREIAVVDTVTLYGVATGYTWAEVTRTQDVWDIYSKLYTVGKTIEIEETATSTLPTTTVETTVDVTTTALSTAGETIYDAFTSIVPVAVTDVKKFTYTATVFTDATSTYSLDATHTVGTIATTTLTTLTTVTNGVTSTITTVLSTDVTVTAQAIATQTCSIPIADGDFEYAPGTSPWWTSKNSYYDWDKVILNGAHHKVMQTRKLYNNKEFLAYQDATTCKGVTFQCTYDYYFDKYYYVKYTNKKWYVPYLRINWNNDLIGEHWPESTSDAGIWWSGDLEFTATGKEDTIWIHAASPQDDPSGYNKNKPLPSSAGDNFLRFDNFVCRPTKYKGHYGPVGGFQI